MAVHRCRRRASSTNLTGRTAVRRRPTKLLLVGAPDVDVAGLGLHTARAVGRSYFEPSATESREGDVSGERKWFDCITATSGSSVVATPWSIARHALDIRTDDHWIVFVDDASSASLDASPDITRLRRHADLHVRIDDTTTTEVVARIAESWRQWIAGHE
ncbi:MAG: hypothetical protein ABJH68_07155 [Ilumatobacter sp.]|uniref:hypothetical protein n=1 Tax=Ilumatobacter sp. TaxID=1967498 RepID=UPI0032995160